MSWLRRGCVLRVAELSEELFFVHDRVDAALADDAGLGHLLHGEQFALFALLDLPHLAEAATTNHILEVEVVLVNGCKRGDVRCTYPGESLSRLRP